MPAKIQSYERTTSAPGAFQGGGLSVGSNTGKVESQLRDIQRGVAQIGQAGAEFQRVLNEKNETRAIEAFDDAKLGGMDEQVNAELVKTGKAADGMTQRIQKIVEDSYNSGSKDVAGPSRRSYRKRMRAYGAGAMDRASKTEAIEGKKRIEASKLSDVGNAMEESLKAAESDGYSEGSVALGEVAIRDRLAVANDGKDEHARDALNQSTLDSYYSSAYDALVKAGRVDQANRILAQGKDSGVSHKTATRLKGTTVNSTDKVEEQRHFSELMAIEDPVKQIETARRKLSGPMEDNVVARLKAERLFQQDVVRAADVANDRLAVEEIDSILNMLEDEDRLPSAEENAVLSNKLSNMRDPYKHQRQTSRVRTKQRGQHIVTSDPEDIAELEEIAADPDAQEILNQKFIPEGRLETFSLSPGDRVKWATTFQTIADTGSLPFESILMKQAKEQYQAEFGKVKRQGKSLADWLVFEKELAEAFGNEKRRNKNSAISPERRTEIVDFYLKDHAFKRLTLSAGPFQVGIGDEGFNLLELPTLSAEDRAKIRIPSEEHVELALAEAIKNNSEFAELSETEQKREVQAAYVNMLEEVLSDRRGAF